jgi:hypothetical protein
MTDTTRPIVGCCTDFKNAQRSGTDNEGYGRLLDDYNGEWRMGSGLSNISYCPWCGTQVSEIKP